MDSLSATTLLAPDEPAAVTVVRPGGTSPALLVCEHAGRRLPRRLGDLGLPASELKRHIAWDIGAGAVAALLSEALDATAVVQTYSRLVIDCNRSPDVPTSIVEISETTHIPGNVDLSPAEREARVNEIFRPFHDQLAALIDERVAAGRPLVLVTVHSFTPVFKSVVRPWHIGVLSNRDRRFADIMLRLLRAEEGLAVGDNQPYFVSDLTDYTVPVHGEKRGLVHVELELRQDLIGDEAGQHAWAARLARLLPRGIEELTEKYPDALRRAA